MGARPAVLFCNQDGIPTLRALLSVAQSLTGHATAMHTAPTRSCTAIYTWSLGQLMHPQITILGAASSPDVAEESEKVSERLVAAKRKVHALGS